MKNLLSYLKITFVIVVLLSSISLALEMPSTPRMLGMGGVSVAVGNGSIAPIYNPALIRFSSNFISGDIPSAGLQVRYSKNIFSDLSYLKDVSFDSIAKVLNNKNTIPGKDVDSTSSAVTGIINHLNFINQPIDLIQQNVVSAILPFGFGLYYLNSNHYSITAGSQVQNLYHSYEKIEDTLRAIQRLRSQLPLNQKSKLPGSTSNPDNDSYALPTNLPYVDPDVLNHLNINTVYYSISEIGIAYSYDFKIWKGKIAFGVTPKYQNAQAHFSTITLGDIKNISTVLRKINGKRDYGQFFNTTIGLAYAFEDGIPGTIYLGTTAQNIITHTLKTSIGKVYLDPLYTVGLGYEVAGFTISSDMDVTKMRAPIIYDGGYKAGYDNQKLRLGAEYQFLHLIALRAGESISLIDDIHPLTSLGIGISPGFFKIELAGDYSPTEFGVNLSLGLIF